MSTAHTALPWQIGGHGEVVASIDRLFGASIEIRAPNSHTSSDSTEKQNERSEATAKFIVRACTVHDDLVAACHYALTHEDGPDVRDVLRAALTAAGAT